MVNLPEPEISNSDSCLFRDLPEDRDARRLARFGAPTRGRPIPGPGRLRVHANEQDPVPIIFDPRGDAEA